MIFDLVRSNVYVECGRRWHDTRTNTVFRDFSAYHSRFATFITRMKHNYDDKTETMVIYRPLALTLTVSLDDNGSWAGNKLNWHKQLTPNPTPTHHSLTLPIHSSHHCCALLLLHILLLSLLLLLGSCIFEAHKCFEVMWKWCRQTPS